VRLDTPCYTLGGVYAPCTTLVVYMHPCTTLGGICTPVHPWVYTIPYYSGYTSLLPTRLRTPRTAAVW